MAIDIIYSGTEKQRIDRACDYAQMIIDEDDLCKDARGCRKKSDEVIVQLYMAYMKSINKEIIKKTVDRKKVSKRNYAMSLEDAYV